MGISATTKKPYLLFATPRSGSTPVYHLFAELFQSIDSAIPGGEFFNYSMQTCETSQNGISFQPVFEKPKGLNLDFEFQRRLNILINSRHRYFFKMLSNYTPMTIVEKLVDQYEWIFLERQNKFKQLLIYLKVRCLDIWYEANPRTLKPNSLRALPEYFQEFESCYFDYYAIRNYVRKKSTSTVDVCYEDFCHFGPKQFALNAGFEVPSHCRFDSATGVPIQSLGDQLDIFENQEQIKIWFAQSFLSQRINFNSGALHVF